MKNIILTGFMGTGKSTVGRLLARELGLQFHDIDTLIEAEAGTAVKEIFKAHGEAAFREIEKGIIKKLSEDCYGTGLVIATGGGAVVNPENRAMLKSWGTIICLSASVDEIIKRVGDKGDRPLLAAEDKKGAIEKLLNERAEAYRDCDMCIDTTSRSVEEVVAAIKARINSR